MDETGCAEALDMWAFVELFGHQQMAGRVTERAFGSTTFFQIDVPGEQPGQIKYTRIVNSSSVYSLSPTDEATARRLVARTYMPEPVPYLPPPQGPKTETDCEYGNGDDLNSGKIGDDVGF